MDSGAVAKPQATSGAEGQESALENLVRHTTPHARRTVKSATIEAVVLVSAAPVGGD